MLNDGETIEPHSDTDADTDPSHGGPPKTESPPMPAATTLDNVVEQIVRHARDDNGGTWHLPAALDGFVIVRSRRGRALALGGFVKAARHHQVEERKGA